MGRMERHQVAATSALTASSAQLNALLSQGKFRSSYEILNCSKFACYFVFLSIDPRVLSLYTYGKYLGGRRFAGGPLHMVQA
jgi:hypothetical protein